MQFGMAVAKILPRLIESSMGSPGTPQDVPPVLTSYLCHPTPPDVKTLFETAALSDVYAYLRGSKKLEIPDAFRMYMEVRPPARML